MILALLAALAWAGVTVAIPEGPLVPGMTGRVHVAMTDAEGEALLEPPVVQIDGRQLRPDPTARTEPGVHAFLLSIPLDAIEVHLSVKAGDVATLVRLPVVEWRAAALTSPRSVDGWVGSNVVIRLRASQGVDPRDLRVSTPLGEVKSLRREAEDLLVEIDTSDIVDPVAFSVGFEQVGRGGVPAFTTVYLRKRVALSYSTDEDAVLEVRVGGRTYGPFGTIDGRVRGDVVQHPGDTEADVRLRDAFGNETRETQPLSGRADPSLTGVVSGAGLVGGPLPQIALRGVSAGGDAWSGPTPECRLRGVAEVELIEVAAGTWVVDTAGRVTPAEDLRLNCTMKTVTLSLRVPSALDRPAGLRLRAPDQINADYPEAFIRVLLEAEGGHQLPPLGVELVAEHGDVQLEERRGVELLFDYRGRPEVAQAGVERFEASYSLPLGAGAARWVEVHHGAVPLAGDVEVRGRVFDDGGLPVQGATVYLALGDESRRMLSDDHGWARAVLPLPPGLDAVVVEARTPARTSRRVVFRGIVASGGPDDPDILVFKELPVTAGRVARIELSMDPPVLYLAPGAQAEVRVRMLDKSGTLIGDDVPVLSASTGSFHAPQRQDDGSYLVAYSPDAGGKPQAVVLNARSSQAPATASTTVRLERPPMVGAIGLTAGYLTNFGAIHSPYLALDVDWRIPALQQRIVIRGGLAAFWDTEQVELDDGTVSRQQITVLPLNLSLLYRRDLLRGLALWLGGGILVAPYIEQQSFGPTTHSSFGIMPPGAQVLAGVAKRLPVGELAAELRGTFLARSAAKGGYRGLLGGFSILLGYRFTIE